MYFFYFYFSSNTLYIYIYIIVHNFRFNILNVSKHERLQVIENIYFFIGLYEQTLRFSVDRRSFTFASFLLTTEFSKNNNNNH
jgi:hypothetical protein